MHRRRSITMVRHRWYKAKAVERAIALAVGALLLVVLVIFSVLIFAIVLSIVLLVAGYGWWRARALRRSNHDFIGSAPVAANRRRAALVDRRSPPRG
jgi:uncharacterized iron-regulated membrane protein